MTVQAVRGAVESGAAIRERGQTVNASSIVGISTW